MTGIDTNVLVRWLVGDDARQSARARRLFESARDTQAALFVPSTVMLELEWVLRSRYQFEKPVVLAAVIALLETQELAFQDEAALEEAIHLYRSSTAEFADCVHLGMCAAAAQTPWLTFDRRASKLPGASLLVD